MHAVVLSSYWAQWEEAVRGSSEGISRRWVPLLRCGLLRISIEMAAFLLLLGDPIEVPSFSCHNVIATAVMLQGVPQYKTVGRRATLRLE